MGASKAEANRGYTVTDLDCWHFEYRKTLPLTISVANLNFPAQSGCFGLRERLAYTHISASIVSNHFKVINTQSYFLPFFIALCTKSMTAVAGCVGSISPNTNTSCSIGLCGLHTTIPKHL